MSTWVNYELRRSFLGNSFEKYDVFIVNLSGIRKHKTVIFTNYLTNN